MSAFRLYDYRVFCTGCSATLDVRGTSVGDAIREANQKQGWKTLDRFGVICHGCYWKLIKDGSLTTSDNSTLEHQGDPDDTRAPDPAGHPGATGDG